MSRALAVLAVLAVTAVAPAGVHAAFPYPAPGDYRDLRVADQTPDDLTGKLEWMYAATPAEAGADPLITLNNNSPFELGGVRGGHLVDAADGADTAWKKTTGRPDVAIAVLDSGIKWNDRGAMIDLRRKTRISKGEAKKPRHDRGAPIDTLPAGKTCANLADDWDANGDGVFNVSDYACDSRVELAPAKGVGPADLLDPQDVLIAFTDGKDDDGNGFEDDMVGWDFLDDDNDPYDDVQYGHGTGEARDSTAEADNRAEGGGELGACANCMSVHMRVGDSFVADVNRFAQATIYATDNDVLVVQEALGTLNNSRLAREAVKYAYDHGTAVIASAADEAAQHNNWPSSLPGVILVNSVTKYDETLTPNSRSYLQFNGCTNFNSKITVAIPSVSCSSDATGRGSGMAGIVYSAALNAVERGDREPHPDCRRTNGERCAITANEVRQLMATGRVDGTAQVDDVDFAPDPEESCATRMPTCTDPFASSPLLTASRPIVSPLATTRSYPARAGHDQFYGHGRVNMFRAAGRADAGPLPPEVEITSPEWYEQVDPEQASFQVRGQVFARGGAYTCEVYVAPGAYPNDRATPDGDFAKVDSAECDGSKSHTGRLDGKLADVDLNALRARFPATAGSFDGRESGTLGVQPYSGRPNTAPYGFVVKVVARASSAGKALEGEDRRQMHLHRDKDLLPGFPRELGTDGASSPLFVDLDGDNDNELVFGTSDGFVHAQRPDGSQLAGWPVKAAQLPLHTGGRAFATGQVSSNYGGAILASPAAGDLDRDGSPEVVVADLEGRVIGFDGSGKRVFSQEANPRYSGKPLSPFANVRGGARNRTQHGFIGSPVLADLGGDRGLEVVAAGMDRHVYAWNRAGDPLDGYPVLAVDRSKVASIDPETHAVTFNANAGDALNQGAIVNTPAVANVAGAADSPPEIVVGTNEEYRVDQGNEGPFAAGPLNAAAIGALQQAGGAAGLGLANANGRVYAIHADGEDHSGGPFVDGWPVKLGLLMAELLPVVGEGVNGSPVVAEIDCPSGGQGNKVGVVPAAGLGYVLNEDGTSCTPRSGGRNTPLQSDVPGAQGLDATRFPAVGLPAFGKLGPSGATTFFAPVAGIVRALDLAINEYQGGADGIAAWNPETGQYVPGWPAQNNDLSFLTGPAIADIDGQPGEEVLAGTASMDLQAYGAGGTPASDAWPKLSADWMVTTPLVGSFGVDETADDARKTVVAITRRGTVFAYRTTAPACSPGSSPRFHHDNANSGDSNRDAVAPGKPAAVSLSGSTLKFDAPGDDLLCGSADRYELVQSDQRIGGADVAGAEAVAGAPDPAAAGAAQEVRLPPAVKRYVALRAVDEQGNVGRTVLIDTRTGQVDPDPDTSPPLTGSGPGPGGGDSGSGGSGGRPGVGAPTGGGTNTPSGVPRRALPCLPRRLAVSATRIGPARLGARLSALTSRYRVARRSKRAVRLCVAGGGRFLVSARRGRIDLVATTARRHATRQAAPGRRPRGGRVRGARRRARGLLVGTLPGRGRVIYGMRRGRITYVAVTPRRAAAKPRTLAKRLRALGLR